MTSSRRPISFRSTADRFLLGALRLPAAVAVGLVVLIAAFLVREALPALSTLSPWQFLTDGAWYPLSGQYGMAPMLVASLAVTLGAVLTAGPLGIGAAVFCRFYAPPALARGYRHMLGLLAGMPSVVLGFWGLVVLVPRLSHGLGAGIVVLSLMVLPTVALIADTRLAGVSADLVRGGAALGLSREAVLLRLVLPSARTGLVTAVLMAAARAIGETMVVLLVCGNVVRMPGGLAEPVRTLTAGIALEMAYAADLHRAVLFAGGLLLLGAVALLTALAARIDGGGAHD